MNDDYVNETLFDPGPESPRTLDLSDLSPDQRRTIRRNEMLAAGIHPTTKLPLRQLGGETCRTCALLRRRKLGGTYWKCSAVYMTGGPATDVRVSWPACTKWEPTT